MHHIHRTRAFVLKNRPQKEADSIVTLLTADLGVIRAVAQGSRKNESKLRQSIQDYSLAHVALVSGRTGWRLVNAIFIKNFFMEIESAHVRQAVVRIFELVERFHVDELADVRVFSILDDLIQFLVTYQTMCDTPDRVVSMEMICVARILNALGYIRQSTAVDYYMQQPLSIELLDELNTSHLIKRSDLIAEINRAIRDSHL